MWVNSLISAALMDVPADTVGIAQLCRPQPWTTSFLRRQRPLVPAVHSLSRPRLYGKSALALNFAVFVLNFSAIYSQFGPQILLLVPIWLASLVETGFFIPVALFFVTVLCCTV